MIVTAIHDLLAATADVTEKLASWEFTTGSTNPAIFTSRQIPKGCGYPAIIVEQVSSSTFGCRGNKGGDVLVDVSIYDDRDQSDEKLRKIAQHIWDTLHRAALDLGSYSRWGCIAEPPRRKYDPDDFPGYLVQVRVRYTQ